MAETQKEQPTATLDMKLAKKPEISEIPDDLKKRIQSIASDSKYAKQNILIAGGTWLDFVRGVDTAELFNWSKRRWEPVEPMRKAREAASSVIYQERFIISGGHTKSIEEVNINEALNRSAKWLDFPVKLPRKLYGHRTVVYNDRLLLIGGFADKEYSDDIIQINLNPPYATELLAKMPEPRMVHGVELFDDKIIIVGGWNKLGTFSSLDSVLMYDIKENKFKELAPLPFSVHEMATIRLGDNLIVIGGEDLHAEPLDTVSFYSIKTEKCFALPPLMRKRRGCVAVVAGNSIVVMGGSDGDDYAWTYHNSVERFSFDRFAWEELPPMVQARYRACAVSW